MVKVEAAGDATLTGPRRSARYRRYSTIIFKEPETADTIQALRCHSGQSPANKNQRVIPLVDKAITHSVNMFKSECWEVFLAIASDVPTNTAANKPQSTAIILKASSRKCVLVSARTGGQVYSATGGIAYL